MENEDVKREKLIASAVEMYNKTIDEMVKSMCNTKDENGNNLFTKKDIDERVNNVKDAFYSYIKETYNNIDDKTLIEYRKQLDKRDKTINDFKMKNYEVFAFTEDMKSNVDKFIKASNFIVTFGDIPQIQIREFIRSGNELIITCCESEDFCVENYVRKLKQSNKNGKFDIAINYVGRNLSSCRIDVFKSCKIKNIVPFMLNQSSEDFSKIQIHIKFKKHDITTNEGQNNKKDNK